MSITPDKWNDQQCRIENGIFFADDSVILLTGHPQDGYQAATRTSLTSLHDTEPDGWTFPDENAKCRVEAGGIIVTAGATSWEGEGFIAALTAHDEKLLWILHLTESEIFSEIHHDGEIIRAVSSAYPNEYHWLIPLSRPEQLTVTAHCISEFEY